MHFLPSPSRAKEGQMKKGEFKLMNLPFDVVSCYSEDVLLCCFRSSTGVI